MEADTNNNRRKRNYKCIQLQHGTIILGKRATWCEGDTMEEEGFESINNKAIEGETSSLLCNGSPLVAGWMAGCSVDSVGCTACSSLGKITTQIDGRRTYGIIIRVT